MSRDVESGNKLRKGRIELGWSAEQSDIHLPTIARIYEDLRTSSYGKSTDVAKLGVEIMKVKHAHLFD